MLSKGTIQPTRRLRPQTSFRSAKGRQFGTAAPATVEGRRGRSVAVIGHAQKVQSAALLAVTALNDAGAKGVIYLGWIVEEVKAGRKKEYLDLSRGWAIGGEAFKEQLRLRFLKQGGSERAMDPAARKKWRELQWQAQLDALLRRLCPEERSDTRSSAVWKAVVAWCMKSRTDATNGWLEAALSLGSPTFVSNRAGPARDGRPASAAAWLMYRSKSKTSLDCVPPAQQFDFLSVLPHRTLLVSPHEGVLHVRTCFAHLLLERFVAQPSATSSASTTSRPVAPARQRSDELKCNWNSFLLFLRRFSVSLPQLTPL